MRNLSLKQRITVILAILGISLLSCPSTYALHSVIIDNNSATSSERLLFDYQNIHPGFSAEETIQIINDADEPVELRFQEIQANPNDPNLLFSQANLSIKRDQNYVITSPAGYTTTQILDEALCVPSNSSYDLTSHFDIPTDTKNVAQNTTLSVIYTLQVTVGGCKIAIDPVFPDIDPRIDLPLPEVPSTGEYEVLSSTLGATAATGLGLVVAIAIVVSVLSIVRRKSKNSKTSKSYIRASKILTNSFIAICFVILASVVGLTVIAKKTGEPVNVLGFRSFILATGSMEPEYKTNGLVVTRAIDFDTVQVGDLVAFRAPVMNNQIALHRVVSIHDTSTGRELIVKGDNNPHSDGPTVTNSNYLGIAIWHTNFPAYYLGLLASPGGWIPTIAFPLLVVLGLVFIGLRFLPHNNHTDT